jgi:hypothetical protein
METAAAPRGARAVWQAIPVGSGFRAIDGGREFA